MSARAQRLLPFLPKDEWCYIRVLTFLVGVALLALAATGVLSEQLFHQPTSTKYLTTVVVAAAVTFISTIKAPLRPLVFLSVLAVPLDFVFTFNGLQPTPLIALDLVGLIVAMPRRVKSHSHLARMSIVFALFLMPAILNSNDRGYYLTWLAVTVATGWLAYLVARERRGPVLIVSAITLVALLQGAVAIWEFKSGRQLNLYQAAVSTKDTTSYFFNYAGVFRPAGTLPDPIALGQVLCLSIPIAIAWAASQARRWAGFFVAAAIGVAVLGLLLSLDRASIIGGLGGTVMTLVLLPRGARGRTGVLIVTLLAIVVLVALAIAPKAISGRISSIFHPTAAHVATSQGDRLRERQWSAAVKTAEANLLTGVGFGNITNWLPRYGAAVNSASQAQDVWLQILDEGGILGLLAIAGIVVAAARDLASSFSEHRLLVAGLSGGVLASTIAWTTDWELRYEAVAAMLAIVCGLIAALADTQKQGLAPSARLTPPGDTE